MRRTQSDKEEEKVTHRHYRSVYYLRILFFILTLNPSSTLLGQA